MPNYTSTTPSRSDLSSKNDETKITTQTQLTPVSLLAQNLSNLSSSSIESNVSVHESSKNIINKSGLGLASGPSNLLNLSYTEHQKSLIQDDQAISDLAPSIYSPKTQNNILKKNIKNDENRFKITPFRRKLFTAGEAKFNELKRVKSVGGLSPRCDEQFIGRARGKSKTVQSFNPSPKVTSSGIFQQSINATTTKPPIRQQLPSFSIIDESQMQTCEFETDKLNEISFEVKTSKSKSRGKSESDIRIRPSKSSTKDLSLLKPNPSHEIQAFSRVGSEIDDENEEFNFENFSDNDFSDDGLGMLTDEEEVSRMALGASASNIPALPSSVKSPVFVNRMPNMPSSSSNNLGQPSASNLNLLINGNLCRQNITNTCTENPRRGLFPSSMQPRTPKQKRTRLKSKSPSPRKRTYTNSMSSQMPSIFNIPQMPSPVNKVQTPRSNRKSNLKRKQMQVSCRERSVTFAESGCFKTPKKTPKLSMQGDDDMESPLASRGGRTKLRSQTCLNPGVQMTDSPDFTVLFGKINPSGLFNKRDAHAESSLRRTRSKTSSKYIGGLNQPLSYSKSFSKSCTDCPERKENVKISLERVASIDDHSSTGNNNSAAGFSGNHSSELTLKFSMDKRHQQLHAISAETMATILTNYDEDRKISRFGGKLFKFDLVDCRYPFEYWEWFFQEFVSSIR